MSVQLACMAAVLSWAVGARAQTTPPASGTTPASTPQNDTLETARSLGMGTGARASAIGTTAAADNPANLALVPLYHIESAIGVVPRGGGWWVGGTIVDSVSSPLAAGVSFRGIFNEDQSDYSGFDWRLALGYPLSDAIGIGVAARYVKLRPHGQGASGADPGAKGFTMDAALRVTPAKGLQIAALGYNLINRGSALVPMRVGGSLSYTAGDVFTIGGDGLVDLSTFANPTVIAGGGIEYLAAGSVPLRLGYRFDSGRDLHSVTGSLGYVDKRMGVDFALRQDVTGDRDTRLLFTFRYHVQ